MAAAGPQPEGAARKAAEVVASPEFRALVARRWTVSIVLLAALFVGYYGYILLIGFERAWVSSKIGAVTTLAIPLGVAAILLAFVLTAVYVWWANRKYDPEVERLKGLLDR